MVFGKRPSKGGPASPPKRPGDKRQGDRSAVFKNAQLLLSDNSTIECIAKNVGPDGCMISVLGAEGLPDEVMIRLDTASPYKPANIIWREKDEAGVHFAPAGA